MDTATKQPTRAAAKKRSLLRVAVTRTGKVGGGEANTYSSTYTLPMSEADAYDSEQAAAFVMKAVNAQLDFSKSKLRLVGWNTETREPVSFVPRD